MGKKSLPEHTLPLLYPHTFPRLKNMLRFSGLLSALLLLTSLLSAEIPLACTPPQVAAYAPPLFPEPVADPSTEATPWIGLTVDEIGTVRALDLSALPTATHPSVQAAISQWQVRPAHDLEAPAWGYLRLPLPAFLAPVRGSPVPTPAFTLDEAAWEKLESIARTVAKSWLRLRLQIDSKGQLIAVASGNSRLDAVVAQILETSTAGAPLCKPALTGGKPTPGALDLWWDFTLPSDRSDFAEVATELVVPGDNPIPESLAAQLAPDAWKAWLFPHQSGSVSGIFLSSAIPDALAPELIKMMQAWFIPARNRGLPLEVTGSTKPDSAAIHIGAFRSVEESASGLRESQRPKYPKRRFLPNPDGFVRLDLTIGTDGLVTAWEILELSHDRFRQPALEALAEWVFAPRTFDGKPVPARIFLTLPFRPKER